MWIGECIQRFKAEIPVMPIFFQHPKSFYKAGYSDTKIWQGISKKKNFRLLYLITVDTNNVDKILANQNQWYLNKSGNT